MECKRNPELRYLLRRRPVLHRPALGNPLRKGGVQAAIDRLRKNVTGGASPSSRIGVGNRGF